MQKMAAPAQKKITRYCGTTAKPKRRRSSTTRFKKSEDPEHPAGPEGSVMAVEFQLDGRISSRPVNGGPHLTFSQAISSSSLQEQAESTSWGSSPRAGKAAVRWVKDKTACLADHPTAGRELGTRMPRKRKRVMQAMRRCRRSTKRPAEAYGR